MALYSILVACGIVTIIGMSSANKLSQQSAMTGSSPWSHVMLVIFLYFITVGPGYYLHLLSQASQARIHVILSWVFGFLGALVLIHTLFSVKGMTKKIVTLTFGIIIGTIGEMILEVSFGLQRVPIE